MKKLLLASLLLYAAITKAQQTAVLTDADKNSIVDSIAAKLQQYYVFPDKAKEMALYLQKRNKAKAYKAISDYRAFTDTLESDLRNVHLDRHMHVFYDPARVAALKQWRSGPEPTAAMQAQQQQEDSRANYGFVKVERLPGNIGYLDFRQFYAVNEGSKNKVAAAMSFIADADAIIVDLRKNGGGDPEMVQYILSYFVDSTPVHYNTLYDRTTDKTTDFYSLASVKGTKMPTKDLYLLTSHYTFSGAEEFAYDLKNLKRATIIGETTGGGAHPTDLYIINDNVVMAIPFARAINPFTKTNWEGTGVTPDIKIEANNALLQAQKMAMEKLLPKLAANSMEHVWADRSLKLVNAKLNPVTLPADVKASYAGTYGERTITAEGDALYYQKANGPKYKLIALTQDLFTIDGLDNTRLQFIGNKDGMAEKIRGVFENGERGEFVRTSKTF